MAESIWLATKSGQRVSDTGSIEVENLVVDIHLGTAFIDANVKSVFPGTQMKYSINAIPVTVMVTDLEDSSVAQLNNIAELPVRVRVAKILKIPGMLRVPTLA